jgi:hypothetical protein
MIVEVSPQGRSSCDNLGEQKSPSLDCHLLKRENLPDLMALKPFLSLYVWGAVFID